MRTPHRLTITLMLAGALAASPAHAQTALPLGEVVQRIPGQNIETLVTRGLPLARIAPEAGVFRLTIPEGAELVGVKRQEDDYNLAVGMRIAADTNEVFEYYRRLMAEQGFWLVSADYGVERQAMFADGPDAEYIRATFVRDPRLQEVRVRGGIYQQRGLRNPVQGDRIDMLIDREGPYSYVVYAEPQGYAGRQGAAQGARTAAVYDSPLYEDALNQKEGMRYGLYGPVGTLGAAGIQADPTRIVFTAPEAASAFQLERTDPDVFLYRYRVRGGLRELAGFYNRLLEEQGFEQVSGTLASGRGQAIYQREDVQVGLDLDEVGDSVYEARVNFRPVVANPVE